MTANAAYKYADDDDRYESITEPTAANDARKQLTRKNNPGSFRLLERRKKELEKKKQRQTEVKQFATTVNKYVKPKFAANMNRKPKEDSFGDIAVDVVKTGKTALVAVEELIFYLPGYGVQFVAAASFALAVYIADESWWGYFVPVESIKATSWALLIILSFLYAIKFGLAFRTSIFKGWPLLTFPICLLTAIPYLAFFPWPVVWFGIVIFSEK